MLDLIPDLTGRPDWVLIVVVLLLVAGTVGTRLIGRRAGGADGDEEGQEEDRPDALPQGQGGDAQTALVLTKALDLLAAEAVESRETRVEFERMRTELLECSAERDRVAQVAAKAQADLERCNQECRRLALRAIERGGDTGE